MVSALDPAPTSAAPVPKVAAAGQAGVIATIIVIVAKQFGVEVPAEVASAFVVVVMFLAGYFKKSTKK